MLAADTDWDTQGFNVADRELGRRVVQAWARRQARRLGGPAPARLADGGRAWSPRSAASSCSTRRSGAATRSSRTTGRTSGAHLERSGRVSAADLARFEAEIDESAASGAFYWSVVRHAWRARVPA